MSESIRAEPVSNAPCAQSSLSNGFVNGVGIHLSVLQQRPRWPFMLGERSGLKGVNQEEENVSATHLLLVANL